MQKNQKIKTGSFCLIPFIFWLESANLLCRFAKKFLVLLSWNKRTKNSRPGSFCLIAFIFWLESANLLCRFAKKRKFLQRKSPNSGGKSMGFCVHHFLPPLEQRGFLCGNHLEDLFWKKFPFFFTQKSPKSGFSSNRIWINF